MSAIESIASYWLRARKGPKVSVGVGKIVLALRIIGREGPIGRYQLSSALSMGEGVVKALLRCFKEEALIRVIKGRGCSLTDRGQEVLKAFLSKHRIAAIKPVKMGELSLGGVEVAIHLRGLASKVGSGMEQRDEAIKVGGRGAITMVLHGRTLKIPGIYEDLGKTYPSVARNLLKSFDLRSGDVVAVCSANTYWKAEEAALTIALSLTS